MPSEATALNLKSADKAATIERLREQIRKVEAAPRQYLVTLATGIRELDGLGVFRLGSGVELSGEEGAGRASVALSLAASACREKRLVAWVDGPQELYPPAAEAVGVELRRFLMVRPKNPGQLVWAATQLLRSGAFTLVVLDLTHTGVLLSMGDTKKLLDAARTGGSLLVALTAGGVHASGLLRLGLRTQAPAVGGESAQARAGHLRLLAVTPSAPVRADGVAATSSSSRSVAVGSASALDGPGPREGRQLESTAPARAESFGATPEGPSASAVAEADSARRSGEGTERSSRADAERSWRADAERSSRADAERSWRADAERSSRADAERPSRADAERPSRADAERSSSADAERSSRADAERSSRADSARPSWADTERPSDAVGESPADAVVLEVERAAASSAGGLGRTVTFRRSSLVRRGKPWAPRARHVRWEGLAVPSVTPLEVLRRVKQHELREGHGGFYGQHPRQLSLAPARGRHG